MTQDVRRALRYAQTKFDETVADLVAFAKIPSISTAPPPDPACRRSAKFAVVVGAITGTVASVDPATAETVPRGVTINQFPERVTDFDLPTL